MRTIHRIPVARWSILALLAAALGMLLVIRPIGAQDSTIDYPENGMDSVATFTATDPEGAMITWSVLASDDSGIPIDVNGNGVTTDAVDIVAADAADAEHFRIEDGELSFATSPNFEAPSGEGAATNTYKVVVVASDTMTGGNRGYEKVTVEVTDEPEDGTVAWAIQPTSALTAADVNGGSPIMQFQVGAILTASVTDGDTTATNALTQTGWRWYSSSSKTSPGTTPLTTGVTSSTGTLGDIYTVQSTDVGNYIHVQAFYYVGSGLQETATLASDYPVLDIAPTGSAPELTAATREVNEGDAGMDVGAPVTPTGGHGALNYALTGTGGDDAKFMIDPKTGQITTRWDLDREGLAEATADAAGDCADPDGTECTVTVTATDSAGAAATATVTISLENVDDKPIFSDTGNPETISVAENNTALSDTDANVTYAAMDPEAVLVTLSLMGADGALFRLNDSDVLSFRKAPDHENPTDRNRDNVYEVTVRASDGKLYTDRMVRITVTPLNEAPEIAEFDLPVMYVENGTDPVVTLTATDPEGDAITWSLTAGADQADFNSDVSDGMLKFADPPDFENLEGSVTTDEANDTYVVEVTATSSDGAGGTNTDTFTVNVQVTGIDEPGKLTWAVAADGSIATNPTVVQFQIGAVLTATAEDGDVSGGTKTVTAAGNQLRWEWYSSSSKTSPGTTPLTVGVADNVYTVQAGDRTKYIHVRAIYTEGVHERRLLLSSDYPVLDTAPANSSPVFNPTTANREVDEGEKGMTVGDPVTATRGHGVVNYGLSGDDADRFAIDQRTGQITTKVDLDREGEAAATATASGSCSAAGVGSPDAECAVTVTATDAAGASATANVTISIENVDDKPTYGAEVDTDGSEANLMKAEVAENATGTGLDIATYTATDQDGDRVNLTLMGADKDLFKLSNARVLSLKAAPDHENPMDANKDNVYLVTVRATDTTGMYVDRMVMVTVTNVDEPPVIMRGGVGISGPASSTYEENGTDEVGTYTATGMNAASARWDLEGADMGDFTLSASSGGTTMLRFRSSPDYEAPADADENNVYIVTVKATVGDDSATRQVTVTVTDDDNEPTTLLERYDADDSGEIEKNEMFAAINDYLFEDRITQAEMFEVINLYLFG